MLKGTKRNAADVSRFSQAKEHINKLACNSPQFVYDGRHASCPQDVIDSWEERFEEVQHS